MKLKLFLVQSKDDNDGLKAKSVNWFDSDVESFVNAGGGNDNEVEVADTKVKAYLDACRELAKDFQ